MKFDLKDFQMAAVAELSQQINSARDEILKTGSLQAVALSSPTGSGKTIILAAIIEKILTGGEAGEARPDSTFLWFSDSPELNAQSLAKVLAATDGFPPERLVTVENTFDQECLLPGYTYFINSQKLGRDKNLTTAGDRNYTFWETVNNTVDKAPGDFYLIVDEAHRGAKTESDFQRATTIVQRFIFGEADVLGPVPMLIGMSATPKRFDELLSRAKRTRRPVEIDPDEVRASGLLKEKIIIAHPAEDETPSDMTLLLEAVRAWKEFGGEWLTYCLAQQIPVVRPILVIQVADGGGSQLTHSPLEAIVRRLEELCSPLSDEELAHCFEVDTTVEVGGRRIRKVEPSRVQDEPFVKFVFFKTSLSTGWDCPRAEVMMSFRRAKEDTLVAQLVGRMVRTPLARKVEANDLLNTVNLYLPYYDGAALKAVLERLKNPDPNNGIAISVSKAEDVVNYPRAVGTEALFERLALLPSYVIDRIPKVSDAKRLIKLARQLNLDKLDRAALEEAKSVLISSLEKSRGHLRASDEFAHQLEKAGTIKVKSLTFRFGSAIPVDDEKTIELALTRENIEDVFERCEKMIAPSEGLHMEYWRRNEQEHGGDQEKIKLELFLLLQDGVAVAELHEAARRKYQALYDRNKHAILALPTSQREAYRRLQGAAKDPAKFPLAFPTVIQADKAPTSWRHHLYADAKRDFQFKANGWEEMLLREETQKPGFLGWLRNVPRKSWSLSIPYQKGADWHAFYPDFIMFRQVDGNIVVDVFDPHDHSRTDNWQKAKGLAEYARMDNNGDHFGRLELCIVKDGVLRRINLNELETRQKVLGIISNMQVDSLYT